MRYLEGSRQFKTPFFTRGTIILSIISAIGIIVYLYRIITGLTVTNLNNQYPWGIWIAIDVATGVALAQASNSAQAEPMSSRRSIVGYSANPAERQCAYDDIDRC